MLRTRLLALFVLVCGAMAVRAQNADSAIVARARGLHYMSQQHYSQAYIAFKYYLDNIPEEECYTETHTEIMKKLHQANKHMKVQAADCYESARKAQQRGESRKADSLFQVYLDMCVTQEMRLTHATSTALQSLAMTRQRQGQMDECLQLLDSAIAIRRVATDTRKVNVAETLNLKAAVLYQMGRFDEALAMGTEAAEVYRNYYGKKDPNYASTLSNLSKYYISRNAPGDRQRALKLGEESLNILPKKSEAYSQVLIDLVLNYSITGDLVKAQKYSVKAMNAMKKMDQNSLNYAANLSNWAIRLAKSNNYTLATQYAYRAIGIFKANNATEGLNYAKLLTATAAFEKHVERYPEAIALWEQAVPIYERIEGKGGSNYLDCMSEISAAHARMGNNERAATINEELQTTASEKARQGDKSYARSLVKRASLAASDGNYPQAIAHSLQALSIFRFRQDVADEASVLKSLSDYLRHSGRLDEAIDTCQLSIRIYEGLKGYEEDYALALNSLTICYCEKKQYSEALATSRRAAAMYEQAGRTETSLYAKVLTTQAFCEDQDGNQQQAINLSLRADSIQRRILGDIHPDNVMPTFNIANYYLRMGKTDLAQQYLHRALRMQMQHVRSNFTHRTTRGRELYWGTKNYIFRSVPHMACLMENNDSAMVDAYDAQLFTKGILLNSEVDFRNLLAQTASPELQEKYAELESIHKEVEQTWREKPKDTDKAIQRLNQRASRLEREIVRGCKEFGDFTEAMNIRYRQVADVLGPEDAAIEFFDVNTPDGRAHWALVARHDWAAPHLVSVCSDNDFRRLTNGEHEITDILGDSIGIEAVFNDARVGQLIWGKLVSQLQGVKNVWFSPSGLFYQWGIEYLPYEGRSISDLYALHRVSSTKLLVQNVAERPITLAAVFGGLDYNADAAALRAANDSLDVVPDIDYLAAFNDDEAEDMAMADTRAVDCFLREGRGSVDPLPGTKVEADSIGACLMMREIDTEMYLKARGTEEAFKRLSGRGVSLLHVATHGFAYSEAAVRRDQNAISYLGVSGDEAMQADNSLCYSGLLLSGANNVLSGKPLPAGMENGILTAREIAKLDFRNLDLAVLSACQTGLGELKEDGVFGLQRGFKKAGAHTLLMSLWSVNDKATQLMMTNFYTALASGQSRREAFHSAQQSLRSDPEYSSPFYWASFVMLDD